MRFTILYRYLYSLLTCHAVVMFQYSQFSYFNPMCPIALLFMPYSLSSNSNNKGHVNTVFPSAFVYINSGDTEANDQVVYSLTPCFL